MSMTMDPQSPDAATLATPPPIPPNVPSAPSSNPVPFSSQNATDTRDYYLASRRPLVRDHGNVTSDLALAARVRTLFQQARSKKAPLISRWRQSHKVLRNRWWSDTRPTWMPSPEVPEIFPLISARVGWMTDQRFMFEVTPSAIPHSSVWNDITALATDLSQILDSSWIAHSEEAQITMALWDGEIYGTGILKTTWDMSVVGGMGDATVKRIDPYSFYPDPNARSMDDANYFIEARKVSLIELDRRFPGAGRLFVDGGGMEEGVDEAPTQIDDATSNDRPRGFLGPITGTGIGNQPAGVNLSGTYARTEDERFLAHPGVTVLECWMREHEYLRDPQNPSMIVGVYDSWRVVVVVGNHVLMNEPAERLWSHSRHPYSRYVPFDIGEFWGLAMVELLAPSQISINRILMAMQLHAELTGNPVLKESPRANTARVPVTNKPGQRVPVGDGGMYEWMNPPQLSQTFSELLNYFLSRMETVSGLSAITRGGNVSGRQAQGVMDAMQEAAFVTIRLVLRQVERVMHDAGELKASLIAENYTEPRVISVLGPEGSQTLKSLRARHFYLPRRDDPSASAPMRFSINVDAGSRLHTSRKMREDRAIMLFSLGAIDEWAVLEALDYPNRAQIHARVMEMKAQGLLQPPGQRKRAQG